MFDPAVSLSLLFILVISIALHEYGHAAMSTKLGDPIPRAQGRLTLNPVAHFDPLGFIFVLLIVFVGFFFAWGKPVQTNPLYYERFRQGIIMTALAGPAVNLALAMLGIAVAFMIFSSSGFDVSPNLRMFLRLWVVINVVLMSFNLLPIPPLDGGHVLEQLAPRAMKPLVDTLKSVGILVLMAVIFLGLTRPLFAAIFATLGWVVGQGFGSDFALFLGLG